MANLEIKKLEESSDLELQLFDSRIQAGFPSPAQGSFADSVDLNHELINNPAATFCARVIGDSMIDSGINEGDMLIIDRSIEPQDGDIAVCFIDGDFTVKRILIKDKPSLFIQRSNYGFCYAYFVKQAVDIAAVYIAILQDCGIGTALPHVDLVAPIFYSVKVFEHTS